MGIKQILLKILGEKRYLSLLANTFQQLYPTGKLGRDYQDVYFLEKIVESGSYCADIGAHLGYFTIELSRLCGTLGKVIAIEPMPQFNQTLALLLKRRKKTNVTLLQVALGGDSEYVEMGIPQVDKSKKFAYARVMKHSEHFQYLESVKVKNESGDHLFRELPRLDYIKCDVEGLEVAVFSSMLDTLRTHHPMLMCELVGKAERIRFYDMVSALGYRAYILEKGYLNPLDVHSDDQSISHNNYFLPEVHRQRLRHLIRE